MLNCQKHTLKKLKEYETLKTKEGEISYKKRYYKYRLNNEFNQDIYSKAN